MKKKVSILDEAGVDILLPPVPPSLTKMIKLADSIPTGKVLSMQEAARRIGVTERQISKLGNSEAMAGRFKRVGHKSYLMNKKTYELYEKAIS